ncbi:MAG TPA: CPBP family intramembrane glutamic endopeptidase [Pyrinomonadaceae bacterium]|nr:CPBP family intramembrane glutamic endopeptidase [Pyrinomonadaceae bacterium]
MPNPDEASALPTAPDLHSRDLTTDQKVVPDPNNPAWGIGGALLVWFASIFLILLMPVLFLIPYATYRGLHPAMPNYPQAIAEFALSDKTAVLLQVVSLLPSHLLTMILVWALVTRFGKQSFWPAIGWGWLGRWRLWTCIGLGVILFIVGSVMAKLLGADKPNQLEQIINSSLAARYTISILAVATAPFVEEFIYRGVLYAPLQRLAGVPGAVAIVLALFTLIHVPQYWPNFGVIAAVALLSVVLTLIRAYSGRLLPCIMIHLVFNGIQAVLLIVEPHVQRFLPSAEPPASSAGSFLIALAGQIL